MLVAELDKVGQVGRTIVDPVHDMVYVRELSMRAAGETASLVATTDLNPLRITGIAPGPAELEAVSRRSIGRDHDLGIACQTTGDFSGDRTEDVELGAAAASGQEAHVGMDDDGRPVSPRAAGSNLSRALVVFAVDVALARGHESVGHPLVEWSPIA